MKPITPNRAKSRLIKGLTHRGWVSIFHPPKKTILIHRIFFHQGYPRLSKPFQTFFRKKMFKFFMSRVKNDPAETISIIAKHLTAILLLLGEKAGMRASQTLIRQSSYVRLCQPMSTNLPPPFFDSRNQEAHSAFPHPCVSVSTCPATAGSVIQKLPKS